MLGRLPPALTFLCLRVPSCSFAGSLPREWATMGSALRTDNTVFAGLIPIGALSDTSVIRVAENRVSFALAVQ